MHSRARSPRAFRPRTVLAALALAVAAVHPAPATEPPPGSPLPPFPTAAIADDVAILADPALGGRATGSPGAALAARYLRQRLRSLGLEPVPGTDDGFQPVALARIAFDRAAAGLAWTGAAGRGEGRSAADLLVDVGGRVDPAALGELEVAWAGWGIRAPERGHDDFAGLDVRGKAVLVLAGEPRNADGTALLGPGRMTRHGLVASKLAHAARAGARAVVVVSEAPLRAGAEAGPKLVLAQSALQPLLLQLGPGPAARLLAAAGLAFDELRGAATVGAKVARPLPGFTLRVALPGLAEQPLADRNVLAWRPGSDPALMGAPVLVVAHFDHLGVVRGADGREVVHPGADDNASGLAGLLEIAAAVASGPALPRPVVFAAVTGEEHDLLGSRFLAAHPLPAGARYAAVVNLDQLGRHALDKRENASVVMASFAARCPLLLPWLTDLRQKHGLDLRRLPHLRPVGRSDDAPFEEAGIPTVFLFTGSHRDYHGPGDTAEKVDAAKIARIARLATDLVRRLAAHPGALPWDTALSEAPPSDSWDRPY